MFKARHLQILLFLLGPWACLGQTPKRSDREDRPTAEALAAAEKQWQSLQTELREAMKAEDVQLYHSACRKFIQFEPIMPRSDTPTGIKLRREVSQMRHEQFSFERKQRQKHITHSKESLQKALDEGKLQEAKEMQYKLRGVPFQSHDNMPNMGPGDLAAVQAIMYHGENKILAKRTEEAQKNFSEILAIMDKGDWKTALEEFNALRKDFSNVKGFRQMAATYQAKDIERKFRLPEDTESPPRPQVFWKTHRERLNQLFAEGLDQAKLVALAEERKAFQMANPPGLEEPSKIETSVHFLAREFNEYLQILTKGEPQEKFALRDMLLSEQKKPSHNPAVAALDRVKIQAFLERRGKELPPSVGEILKSIKNPAELSAGLDSARRALNAEEFRAQFDTYQQLSDLYIAFKSHGVPELSDLRLQELKDSFEDTDPVYDAIMQEVNMAIFAKYCHAAPVSPATLLEDTWKQIRHYAAAENHEASFGLLKIVMHYGDIPPEKRTMMENWFLACKHVTLREPKPALRLFRGIVAEGPGKYLPESAVLDHIAKILRANSELGKMEIDEPFEAVESLRRDIENFKSSRPASR